MLSSDCFLKGQTLSVNIRDQEKETWLSRAGMLVMCRHQCLIQGRESEEFLFLL